MRNSSDTGLDISNIKQQTTQLVPQWKLAGISAQNVSVEEIVSGLTNRLFIVKITDEKTCVLPKRVIYRIYGKHIRQLYDPHVEVYIFEALARCGIGPNLVAKFEGGRIEEYLEGRPIPVRDTTKIPVLTSVARALARLHTCDIKISHRDFVCKPTLFVRIHAYQKTVEAVLHASPTLAVHFRPYASMIGACVSVHTDIYRYTHTYTHKDSLAHKDVYTNPPEDSHTYIHKDRDPADMHCLCECRCAPDKIVEAVNTAMSVVFSHNDLQENNMLMSGESIRLIDFEYSTYNYAALDIANFFCECSIDNNSEEYPHFKFIPENFPDKKMQEFFVHEYLAQRFAHTQSGMCVEAFLKTVQSFVVINSLLWGLWGIIRAHQERDEASFDFIGYAKMRFDMYEKGKCEMEKMEIEERFKFR